MWISHSYLGNLAHQMGYFIPLINLMLVFQPCNANGYCLAFMPRISSAKV